VVTDVRNTKTVNYEKMTYGGNSNCKKIVVSFLKFFCIVWYPYGGFLMYGRNERRKITVYEGRE
jgi:hypothetical protein